MDSVGWFVVAVVLALTAAGCAAVLLVRLIRARKLLRDAGVPLRSKALFWTAVVYTVSPVDLIPDPVYLDDIGVLLLALRALHSAAAAGRPGGGPPRAGLGADGEQGGDRGHREWLGTGRTRG
ncbi:YkvA family protein [Streptomyces sp. NPDC048639]|uniref:YkvA family protein n=1 Tax=Streptomyces sp. NPDC048639 TaxID=3365581 RepID=UPI0037212E97